MRLKTEKTYSAPLASYSFSKELIELEDGKKIRDYPRLLYGGANLDNPKTDSTSDIIKRISLGFLYGLLISSVIILLIIFSLSKVRNEKFIITLKKCLSKEMCDYLRCDEMMKCCQECKSMNKKKTKKK